MRAFDMAIHHSQTHFTPEQAMTSGTRIVQRELNRAFDRERNPIVPMALLWTIIVAAILALIGVLFMLARKTGTVGSLMRSEAVAGYTFAAPWLIGFLVFTVGPIVASIVFSFCDYDVLHEARWVGLGNYGQLFTYDWGVFSKALYNAAFLAVIGLPMGIVAGLSIALLLNANVKGMSWYRTLYYLPSIVPVVASAVLWLWVLNPQFGIVNAGWKATLTTWFGLQPPGWLSQPGEFFGVLSWLWKHTLSLVGVGMPSILAQPASYLGAKSALVTMGLWGAGGGMIIWLAGLKGIPDFVLRGRGDRWRERLAEVPRGHDPDAEPVYLLQPDNGQHRGAADIRQCLRHDQRPGRAGRCDPDAGAAAVQQGFQILQHGLRVRAGVDSVHDHSRLHAFPAQDGPEVGAL